VPGKGSKFEFELFFYLAAEDEIINYKKDHIGASDIALKSHKPGLWILLVEDNEVNQVFTKTVLEEADYQIDVVNNGLEAIEQLAQKKYDCVLMDIHMPVMDGFEATIRIRQQTQYLDLPIIAMTASALESSKEQCLSSGMNDYIGKPVSTHELNAVLAKWIKPEQAASANNTLSNKAQAQLSDIEQQSHSDNLNGGIIDVATALKRFNNEKLYFTLLQLFKSNQNDVFEQLSVAIEHHEVKQIHKILHTLKGIAAQIGAERLYSLTLLMEANNKYSVGFADMMLMLQSELEQVFSEIDHLLCQHDEAESLKEQAFSASKEIVNQSAEFNDDILMLHQLIKEFDTEAVVVLQELQTRLIDETQLKHLQKLSSYLEQFKFERADDYLSKHMLTNL